MLTLLPTPIGNVDDISIRAMRVLEEAEVLICEDTRVGKKLLHLLAERHGLQSRIETYLSLHSHNEESFLARLRPDLFERPVVYMSDAGMPGISDPGAALVRWCQEHGVAYTVLPGPSASVTAYAASGFASTSFLFYGFLPHKSAARREALGKLLRTPWPVVLYESPHRLTKLLEELEALAPERELFAAKEISKRHERYFRGSAARLRSMIEGALGKGEWVVILSASEEERDAPVLDHDAIAALDLPPRQKAKLLAKLTGRSVKACYDALRDTSL